MFADNSGGKFINEYEGIENAKILTASQEEELQRAYEELAAYARELVELLQPAIEAVAQAVKQCAELIKQAIPTVLDFVVVIMAQIIELYPNKRVVHLAKHARKERVRKKNINKILKWYARGGH